MGYIESNMDKLRITGFIRDDVSDFLTQWNNNDKYITAHTSGSTGIPKQICLLKSDMIVSANNTNRFFGLNEHSRFLLNLSADYIAGKMMIVRAIVANAILHVVNPSNNPLYNVDPQLDIDLMAIVPSQINGVLTSESANKIKHLIIGGAAIDVNDEICIIKSGINAYATYGMTETCSHVALRKLGTNHYKALPGIELATDYRGCLTIISSNYSFGTLITNDSVELIDNTSFKWLGRIDNVINSGGIKIHPEEIEKKIAQIMGNRLFYITSRKSKLWGEELILIVEGSQLSNEILSLINQQLSRFEHPKEIIYLPIIPLTQSGKIKRQKF